MLNDNYIKKLKQKTVVAGFQENFRIYLSETDEVLNTVKLLDTTFDGVALQTP